MRHWNTIKHTQRPSVHVYMEKQLFKELEIDINNLLTSKLTFAICSNISSTPIIECIFNYLLIIHGISQQIYIDIYSKCIYAINLIIRMLSSHSLKKQFWMIFSLSLWFENLWAFCREMQNRHKAGGKSQLGTQIADVSCVQRQIKTAGPLQRDVIWSITVLSFNKKTHTYTRFQAYSQGNEKLQASWPTRNLFVHKSQKQKKFWYHNFK